MVKPVSDRKSNEPIPGTQAVRRVLSILAAFTDEAPRWSLTELSGALGLNKATAHRMLGVLEQEGYLYRSEETGEYQLGPEAIVLGARALKAMDIRTAARPELLFLSDATGEDASVEALVDGGVLILDQVRGKGLMGLATEAGTRWPTHATATGKVLLAFSDEDLSEPEGGLEAVTEHTIVSWEEFTDSLAEVRELGYAINMEELVRGYASVAALVRDSEGRPFYSVCIGGSIHRVTPERIPSLAEMVQEAAERLSRRLGYRGDEE